MKFRNYCIVVMGDTKGVIPEIEKISEIKPHVLDAKGILIATFSSFVEPKELTDWFRLNKRNFLVFDLNQETSGFYVGKKDIQEGLFGFLKNIKPEDLDAKSAELLREIEMSSNTKNSGLVNYVKKETKAKGKKILESDIEKMTKTEKEKLFDEIIDNGVENLSEHEKNLLQLLAKK